MSAEPKGPGGNEIATRVADYVDSLKRMRVFRQDATVEPRCRFAAVATVRRPVRTDIDINI
jgi:hypothetical protein